MIGHVFKYEIPIADGILEVDMPDNCKICEVNCQGESLFIWAIVDIHAPFYTNKFMVFGTGHKIDNAEKLRFIKTVHMPSGLVWHVFAVIGE